MVNQPDKKDLIIQSLVNQRNNALNALSDCESNLIIAQQKIAELEAENTELKKVKDEIN